MMTRNATRRFCSKGPVMRYGRALEGKQQCVLHPSIWATQHRIEPQSCGADDLENSLWWARLRWCDAMRIFQTDKWCTASLQVEPGRALLVRCETIVARLCACVALKDRCRYSSRMMHGDEKLARWVWRRVAPQSVSNWIASRNRLVFIRASDYLGAKGWRRLLLRGNTPARRAGGIC
jgi:hypothetical protein